MVSYKSTHIRFTTEAKEFEKQCVVLFKELLNDPNGCRLGTHGQKQDGVDIIGRRNDVSNRIVGIQCKLISEGKKLTKKIVEDEIKKALKFKPMLSEYIIVTTAKNDTKLQQQALEISQTQLVKGRNIEIGIWGRDTLEEEINKSEAAKNAFDPGFSPSIESQNAKLKVLVDRQDVQATKSDISALATKEDISKLVRENPVEAPLPQKFANDLLKQRLDRAKLRRNFATVDSADDYRKLAESIDSGELILASATLKAEVFDRNARINATTENLETAKEYRDKALALRSGWDLSIADALIAEASGNQNACLRLLRSRTDPESRSALLIALFRQKGDEAAFNWVVENNIRAMDLSVQGLPMLTMLTKDQKGLEEAYELARNLPANVFKDAPVLYLVRSQITLSSILPEGVREQVFQGLPINPRILRFESGKASQDKIKEALLDIESLLSIVDEFGLGALRGFLHEQILWLRLELIHERDAAIEQLAEEVSDPELTLERVRLALSYQVKFDQAAILRELDSRRILGGWNDGELFAAFLIAYFNKDTRKIIAFLQQYRSELFEQFSISKGALAGIEVEALAQISQFKEAKQRIVDHVKKNYFNAEQAVEMEKLVASLEEGSELEYLEERFENSDDTTDLLSLVGELRSRGEGTQLKKYAPILARRTKSFGDVLLAANELYQADQFKDVIQLAAELEEQFDEFDELSSIQAWSLLSLGRVLEAQDLARKLFDERSLVLDRELVINCAVGCGDWAHLQSLLAKEFKRIEDLPADDLIRLSQLSYEVDSKYMDAFRQRALLTAKDNPDVYLKAYALAMELGEDVKEATGNLLQKAVELSGDQGPVQKVSLQQIVDLSNEHSEKSEKFDLMLKKAELPVFLAAKALNRQHFDLLIGQAFRNTDPDDGRFPYPVFAFSGERTSVEISTNIPLALDISTIATLHFLGQLDKAIECFDHIIIAPSTLTNLFAEKQFLKVHQPSELEKAKRILELVTNGALKVISPKAYENSLAKKIGRNLAGLLAEAEDQSGLVVQTAPVHRVGSLVGDSVDMAEQLPLLVDLRQILLFLSKSGAIEAHVEKSASAFFVNVDVGWNHSPIITAQSKLYLDSLTVRYLDQFDLLRPLLEIFSSVCIHKETKDQAKAVLGQAKFSERILDSIEQIRATIHSGLNSGSIDFSSRHMPSQQEQGTPLSSETSTTMDLVIDVSTFQAVGVDDRCLNKNANWTDNNSCSAKTVTTLDILNTLNSIGQLSEHDLYTLRHKLRKAGFYGVSVKKEEINYFVSKANLSKDGCLIETPELRAIRESISFPILSSAYDEKEYRWLADTSIACLQAIKSSWFGMENHDLAQAQSDWILSIVPNPFHFFNSFEDENKWHIAVEQKASQFALLAGAIEGTIQVRAEYYLWLEDVYLNPIKLKYSDIWHASINRLKWLAEDLWKRLEETDFDDKKLFFISWIETLPSTIQSELLKDGDLVARIDIKPIEWLQISQNTKVTTESFYRAVRLAINGKKTATLKLADGKTKKAALNIEHGEIAVLKIGKSSHRILHAGLFSNEKEQRISALEGILKNRLLPFYVDQKFEKTAIRRAFSIREFVEIQKASSETPEAIIEELRYADDINVTRLIPEGSGYYETLLAPIGCSNAARDFVEQELFTEYRSTFNNNRSQTIERMGYSAVWHHAIPFKLLSKISASDIQFLLEKNDPYSLVLGVEICAEFSQKDDEFIALGSLFIDKLLLDEGKSLHRCAIFSACAIISLAHVRTASKISDAPTFWQRLVALSHAGVLTNGLFRLPDFNGFFQWSQENFATDCYWYNVVDQRDAPGWGPNWLAPKLFYAELFGRVINCVNKIPVGIRPDVWVKQIEKSQRRIVDVDILPYAFFPGPMDPFGDQQVLSSKHFESGEIEEQLSRATKLADVPGIALLQNLTQPSEKVVTELIRLLKPESAISGDGVESSVLYLQVAASISSKCRSVSLANAVIDRCLSLLVGNETEELEISGIFGIMLLSCASYVEINSYYEAVSSVAERTCYAASLPKHYEDLLSVFELLPQRDPKLASALAKAICIAKFKSGRILNKEK